jgi:hypothetical protein
LVINRRSSINQLVVAGQISADEAETLQQHADLLQDQLEDAYDREHGKYHTSGQDGDDQRLAPDL